MQTLAQFVWLINTMLLYSLLHLTGYPAFPIEEVQRFRVLGSVCEGHPERPHDQPNGIEVTTGPLGQGIANAFGMAVAEAYLNARLARTWSTTSPTRLWATVACKKAWAKK